MGLLGSYETQVIRWKFSGHICFLSWLAIYDRSKIEKVREMIWLMQNTAASAIVSALETLVYVQHICICICKQTPVSYASIIRIDLSLYSMFICMFRCIYIMYV